MKKSPGRIAPGELAAVLKRAEAIRRRKRRSPRDFRVIGGCKLLHQLGRGATGRVYLARRKGEAKPVALKVLDPWVAQDREFLERFKREAEAAANLSHPNCVALLDSGYDEDQDLHYIVFEYIEGGSLEEILQRQGRVRETRALHIALGIARALEYMDSAGIVHRDVKPANILLSRQGIPKLADLGLARQKGLSSVTRPGCVMGTPSYLAPEQLRLDGDQIDVRLDLYALGLCLWEMLTGELPLNTNSSERMFPRHIEEDIPDVRLQQPKVSDGAAQILRSLLARKRGDRYCAPAALIVDLQRVLDGKLPLGSSQTRGLARFTSAEWETAFDASSSSLETLVCEAQASGTFEDLSDLANIDCWEEPDEDWPSSASWNIEEAPAFRESEEKKRPQISRQRARTRSWRQQPNKGVNTAMLLTAVAVFIVGALLITL